MPARTLGGGGVKATIANVWTAIQTFGSGLLKLRNPANTFDYIFKGGAIVADRDVTMPLLTGADTLVTESMAQTLTNKTIGVASMGTGATTLTGVVIGAGTAALAGTALTALQSIRMNAGGTAYEGFTPAAGTVTSVTGTAPLASSGGATPDISVTGAAGQVLAGVTPAFTATPTLGASGTLGSVTMGNATSGTVTLQPVTGALGTVTVSLPAATDTLVGKATTDTLTNKTLTSPAITTPTGIVKGDVGLGNVDNTSDATKDAATATLTNKTLTAPDINGGTADALTSLAVRSTGTGAFDLKIANAENLTVGAKTLTVQVGNADRTLILGASPSLSGTNTGDQTSVSGNAGTATALETARAINGVNFDGTAAITVTAAADTLTGTALNATVVTSSLTSVGTLASPALTTPDINGGTADSLTSLGVRSTGTGAFDVKIANVENLTVGNKTLTVQLGNADRTLILGASPSLSGTNTGDQTITLTGDVTGTGTGSFAATVAGTHAGTAHHTQSHDHSAAGDGTTLAPAAITGWAIGSNVQAYDADLTTLATAFATASAAGAASLLFAEDTDNGTSAAKLQGAAALAADITLTLPATADTLVGRDTTDTLTNKTLTSPTLTTPALGTPASGVMTNVTGIPVGALANGTDGNLITWDANGVAAVVATGNAAQVLTSNGAGAAPTFQAAGGGAVTRAGGTTTEATTTSATLVDLLTASSLSIAVSVPVSVQTSIRKTTGAVANSLFGLKLNTTVVRGSQQWEAGNNEATSGLLLANFIYGLASYLRSGGVLTRSSATSLSIGFSADMPTATLTDVVWQGGSGDAGVTTGMDDMHVYTYAVS